MAEIDLLVLMVVDPGFGGRCFDVGVYAKLVAACRLRDQPGESHEIAVDGGVTTGDAGKLSAASADQPITATEFVAAPEMGPVVRAPRGMWQPA